MSAVYCPSCEVQLICLDDSKSVACWGCRRLFHVMPGEGGARDLIERGLGALEAHSNVPLRLGAQGRLDGVSYTVVGWACYEGREGLLDTYKWEEWALKSNDGATRWLSFAPDEGFLLLEPVEAPSEAPAPDDSMLPVPGGQAQVSARATGQLIGLAGAFDELFGFEDVGEYVTAETPEGSFSFEWFDGELSIFRSTPYTAGQIGKAFGIGAMSLKMIWNALSGPNISLRPESQGLLSLAEDTEAGALSLDETRGEVSLVEEYDNAKES